MAAPRARGALSRQAVQALLTLPGLESFLLGECRRLGIPLAALGDGWALTAADAVPHAERLGLARAVLEVVWTGPADELPPRLPPARRLWFEGQLINGRRRAQEVAARIARAAGDPEPAEPAAADLLAVLSPSGQLLVGRPGVAGLDRRRRYRVALQARSLNPVVARAMAMASHARPGDVFLDPFCGTGTVLAERALLGPAALLGRDLDPTAVASARRNLEALFQETGPLPLDLAVGDARSLDLPPATVSAVATNPPFGHRMGSPRANRALYRAAVLEAARVLRPGGRLVVLTHDLRHLAEAVRAAGPALRRRAMARAYLGGLLPVLAVFERTEEALKPGPGSSAEASSVE